LNPEEYRRKDPKIGTMTKEGYIVGRGENRRVIPPDEVYRLSKLWCSYEEIAEWFEIPVETLKYNFRDLITKGRTETKQALRRAQIKSALEGSTTMLIWLGKNILGQSDNPLNEDTDRILPWSDE
jgi:DNA-binding PadR family transcriptional regulator